MIEGKQVEGKRVDGALPTNPGEYGKTSEGRWLCTPPGHPNLLANITGHTVIEHDDGTITVSPSILVSCHGINDTPEEKAANTWHGYLEKGMWREC